MPIEEAALAEQITLLRIGIAKLETKIDNLTQLDTKIDIVAKVADSAADSSASAHKRINDMVVTIRWIIGLSVPTIGLILTMASILYSILKK